MEKYYNLYKQQSMVNYFILPTINCITTTSETY